MMKKVILIISMILAVSLFGACSSGSTSSNAPAETTAIYAGDELVGSWANEKNSDTLTEVITFYEDGTGIKASEMVYDTQKIQTALDINWEKVSDNKYTYRFDVDKLAEQITISQEEIESLKADVEGRKPVEIFLMGNEIHLDDNGYESVYVRQ